MINKFLDQAKNAVLIVSVFIFSACSGELNSEKKSNASEVNKSVEKEVVSTYTAETMGEEIARIENDLDDNTIPNKVELRIKLVEFYASYSDLFPENDNASDMLFKAGNQSVNLERFEDALGFYSEVEKHYRGYQKRPECIYLQGFIYDTYTDELGKAKEKYEFLISEYPKHVLVEQAEISIANLGKSDADLIRQFEKQNAQ